MRKLQKYRKRESSQVIAVQLALETDGFACAKRGATQTCKAGDWLVNNDGDSYTVAMGMRWRQRALRRCMSWPDDRTEHEQN